MARKLPWFEKFLSSILPCCIVVIIFVLSNYYTTARTNKNVLIVIVPNFRSLFVATTVNRPYTPFLNLFSSECLNFHNAYSQLPSSVPSRNSLFTSRRPDTLISYDNTGRCRKGVFTSIPEYFESHGYQTLSVGKVFPLGAANNAVLKQSSCWSHIPYWPYSAKFDNESSCLYVDKSLKLRLVSNLVCPLFPEFKTHRDLPDEEIVWIAKKYLNVFTNSSENFFLAIGFFRPDFPLRFPIKYIKLNPLKRIDHTRGLVRPKDMPTVAWHCSSKFKNYFDIQEMNITYPFGILAYNDTRVIKQCYHSTLSYVDNLIGQILKELLDCNLYEKTVIVLTGDYGCSLGERGLWGGNSCYDSAIKVPLLIYAPDITTKMKFRKITHELVELVDIFPTIVDLAGLDPLPTCPQDSSTVQLCTEGVSLMPLIETIANSPTMEKKSFDEWKLAIYSQVPRPGVYPVKSLDGDLPLAENITVMGYAIRTLRYKYVEWVKFKEMEPVWSQLVGRELYDFDIDPTEYLNLATRPQLEPVMKQLSKMLHAGWRTSLPIYKDSKVMKYQVRKHQTPKQPGSVKIPNISVLDLN